MAAACRSLRPFLRRATVRACVAPSRAGRVVARWHSVDSHQSVEIERARGTGEKPMRKSHFAFAIDIDGVLLRSNDALPGASEALALLKDSGIPFVLLTNGGGKTEAARVQDLNAKLGTHISEDQLIQSHTPFQALDQYKKQCVLVIGGQGDSCRKVAQSYGFEKIVTTADIFCAHPDIWPSGQPHLAIHARSALPLPFRDAFDRSLKIDAIFVYSDPCDWGLDTQIMADLLLADRGVLGTLSEQVCLGLHNNLERPKVFWANSDVIWAGKWHLPRIGQGGFRAVVNNVIKKMRASLAGAPTKLTETTETFYGKPQLSTMKFAEDRILDVRRRLYSDDAEQSRPSDAEQSPLSNIYMIGDNPDSDIAGAVSMHNSPNAQQNWRGILVKSGVYAGVPIRDDSKRPVKILAGVLDAVMWAMENEGWPDHHAATEREVRAPRPSKRERYRSTTKEGRMARQPKRMQKEASRLKRKQNVKEASPGNTTGSGHTTE